jgi:predicted PurR-regulated permease PerM
MTDPDPNGIFWWIYVALLAGVAAFIAQSFVGILVLGLFGYYATRPIRTRIRRVIESRTVAAALTVLSVLVPVFVLLLYAVIRLFQQLQSLLDESVVAMLTAELGIEAIPSGDFGPEALLGDPPSVDELADLLSGSAVQQGLDVLGAVSGTLILVALAVTLSYALLVHDGALSRSFRDLVGPPGTTAYSYALAVDEDLESVFFGNFLFVLAVSLLATATYGLTNLLAPPGLRVPMVFTLGFLTGITSLVPIVVGKVVYVPVVAYLGFRAVQQGSDGFVFVGGVLVVYFLVLDIIPQSLLQPVISGRRINPMVLLFAYILGPILFGWYGFFLLPILFVLMLETVRIVLPALLQDDSVGPESNHAHETGASPEELGGERAS